ncbi:MAG: hypothetical protein M3P18_09810 [Actinomycetota bacterium]|nr:hypothetical protein [Actinomycetota bacterium]
MSDQVADVLDDAADLLERKGWIQEAEKSPEGFCSLGALIHTRSLVRWEAAARLAKNVTPGASIHLISRSITDWNDAPERTKQEVLDAFRAAAKRERLPPAGTGDGDPIPRSAPPPPVQDSEATHPHRAAAEETVTRPEAGFGTPAVGSGTGDFHN